MKRFLSELWSSEAPANPTAASPGGGQAKVRSLASRLLSPSGSEDESDPAAHKRLKVCGTARTRDSVRVEACVRVRSPALPNLHAGCVARHANHRYLWTLPEPYRFGSTCVVGSRKYSIPRSWDIDCYRLTSVQLTELSALSMILLNLPLQSTRTFLAIWQHCICQVENLIHDFGNQVCVFKIGISANVPYRMAKYKEANFAEMRIIHCSDDANIVAVLEILLIAYFKGLRGCRNVAPGGEGSMIHRYPDGPYFVYCVGARADGKLAIGG